jgi:hypothetical protein
LSGTWRCMGQTNGYGIHSNASKTLFIRTA